MKSAIAIARRFNPAVGAWLVALSGGRLHILLSRTLRLRRLAGAMLHGTLTPPSPVRLQIETTDVCNLRCIHCTRETLDGMNTLTVGFDAFARTVSEIAPFYVTMNGLGEPLVDRTIIKKLGFLHGRGIRTSMPTNGTYIRRHKRDELAAELPDVLQLSIDGATKASFEAIRKLGDFDNIIENYRSICAMRADGKTRPHTTIRVLCALQRANLHDYREMYRLYKSLRSVDSFNLVAVFDYDAEGSSYAGLVPSADEVLALHREIDIAISAATETDEELFYRNWRKVSAEWLRSKNPNRIDPETNTAPCTVPWYSTYIDAKGRVYPCCYLTATEHVMGQLQADGSGFPTIWSGAKYRGFRSQLMTARPTLSGCRTCPRNDDRVLTTLSKLGPLLPKPILDDAPQGG